MKVYLAGIIDGKTIVKCREWRHKIIAHYSNWKNSGKNYGTLCFLNPLNGEDNISKDGLSSNLPPQAIFIKDYNAIKKCDLFIVNMNNFGAKRIQFGCYSDDTEVLTENGWLLFKDLVKKENNNLKVLTLSNDNNIELQKPTKYYKLKNPYGYMFNFKNKTVDLMLTPNHNFVINNEKTKKREFIKAENIPSRIHIPKCVGLWKGQEKINFILPKYKINKLRTTSDIIIKMDDWLNFLGWFISEGCVIQNKRKQNGFEFLEYIVCISQVKKENFPKIESAIKNIKMKYSYSANSFIIHNKQLALYLLNFGKYSYNKHILKEFKNVSVRQLNILINSLVLGDGTVNKKSKIISYYTTSRTLAGDIQEIFLKLGYSANIFSRIRKPYYYKKRNKWIKSNKIQYEVIRHTSKQFFLKKNSKTVVDYNGYVYCCEVPNHTLFVRRNGKAIWCGNSIMEIALAYEFKKPIIMITTEEVYKKHPFTSTMVSWFFNSVEEMLEKKAINTFYKAFNSAP